MATSENEAIIAREVADLLEEQFDNIADLLIASFLEEYPRSKSNEFSHEALKKWSYMELQDLIATLKEGRAPTARNIIYAGDIQVKVDALFQPLTAYIETRLFIARSLAHFIWSNFAEDPFRAQIALEQLEAATIDLIRTNMQYFLDTKLVPGSLSMRWSEGTSHLFSNEDRSMKNALSIPPLWIEDDTLTTREREVALLVSQGKTNGEIAAEMGISQNTVKNHLSRVYDKLNVNTRAELTRRVIANAWA